jgi:hypothetical protein
LKQQKQVLVLARRDHTEAMRVASGLTIFGHGVRLVFMHRPVEETDENAAQLETLELCDIEPETTVDGQGLPVLSGGELSLALVEADCVLSL